LLLSFSSSSLKAKPIREVNSLCFIIGFGKYWFLGATKFTSLKYRLTIQSISVKKLETLQTCRFKSN
jgi:hypothetical protein